MSIVLGVANPVLQKAFLELCFSEGRFEPAFRRERMSVLDAALIKDQLSAEQLRTLPLLYRLTSIEEMSAPSRAKILGIYKHTLCHNSLLTNRLDGLQRSLNAAGFEPLIALKGLSNLAYLQLGLGARPMGDVDILVPRMHERPQDAMILLQSLGFTLKRGGFRSVGAKSPEGLEFDIHWYLHDWAIGADLVDLVRQNAIQQQQFQPEFRIPCIEHHLAHVLAHGIFSEKLTYDARWVVDFLAIYRKVSFIDIDRFAEFANRMAAPHCLRQALDALRLELPASIDVDRAQFQAMAEPIRSNHPIVTWLYSKVPTPNLPTELLTQVPRGNTFKAALIAFIEMPYRLWVQHRISYWDYWRWKANFLPTSKYGAVVYFCRKLLLRGPAFIYRLVRQRHV